MSRHRAQQEAADDLGAGRHRAVEDVDSARAAATVLATESILSPDVAIVAPPDTPAVTVPPTAVLAVGGMPATPDAQRGPRHRASTAARSKPGAAGMHRRPARRRPLPALTPRVLFGGAVASTLTVVSAAAATDGPAGSVPNTVAERPTVSSASGPAVPTPRSDSRVSRADRTAIAGSVSEARVASAGAVRAGVDAEAVVTWALPVTAPNVSSCFGYRGGENHQGADLPKPLGTPIYAVGAGRVVAAGPASGFGYRVVIEHADGVTSTYGHMRYWDVEVGQQVAAGQQIAVVGNEGQSTGPHVHVEIRTQGQTVDPSTFLRARGVELGSL